MESVVFDGKEYIKVSVLAQRFRYTTDYLGQLCRAKKVDARLVGRAWYINLASLEEHRSGRYKNQQPPAKKEEATQQKSAAHYLSRIDVEPVLKQKTVKIMKSEAGKNRELSVRYEVDDFSLIPRVNRAAVSAEIHVMPAEAEDLKIKAEKKFTSTTNFRAEALPEVYLRGHIKVDGIPEVMETDDSKEEFVEEDHIKEPEISPKLTDLPQKPKRISIQIIKRPLNTTKGTVINGVAAKQEKVPEIIPIIVEHSANSQPPPLVRPRVLVQSPTKVLVIQDIQKTETPLQPVRAAVSRVSVAEPVSRSQVIASNVVTRRNESEVKPPGWFLVFLSFLVSVVLAILILGTRSEIFVGDGHFDESWRFDVKELKERFEALDFGYFYTHV